LFVKEAANAVWKLFRQGAFSIEEAKTTLQALKDIAEKVVKIEGELNYLEEAVKGFRHEIIIVDDSSSDGTYELALKLADRAIVKRCEGQSTALLTGIREARYLIVVTMDVDLENDPSEVPRLISSLKAGYDIVVAVRGRIVGMG
jgi:glycosyltransferase involved in cell wall biosynthesis